MIEKENLEKLLCTVSDEMSVIHLLLEGVYSYLDGERVNDSLVPTAVQYALRTQFGRLESKVREVSEICGEGL